MNKEDLLKYCTTEQQVQDLEFLYKIRKPKRTATYMPVSYSLLLEIVVEKLVQYEFVIKRFEFKYKGVDKSGKPNTDQIIMSVIMQGDNEKDILFSLMSSHNKSKAVTAAAGAIVTICFNGNVFGTYVYKRKHTPNVLDDIREYVDECVGHLNDDFHKTTILFNKMKNTPMSDKAILSYTGIMLFENVFESYKIYEKVIEQYKMAKRYKETLDKDTDSEEDRQERRIITEILKGFTSLTVWSVYNWITEALKLTHISHYLEAHNKALNIMSEYINLIEERRNCWYKKDVTVD